MSLLIDKAFQWAVAMTTLNVTILSAIAELLKIYDHPVQGKKTDKWLLSLQQGVHLVANHVIEWYNE